jgi:hypothetical protein
LRKKVVGQSPELSSSVEKWRSERVKYIVFIWNSRHWKFFSPEFDPCPDPCSTSYPEIKNFNCSIEWAGKVFLTSALVGRLVSEKCIIILNVNNGIFIKFPKKRPENLFLNSSLNQTASTFYLVDFWYETEVSSTYGSDIYWCTEFFLATLCRTCRHAGWRRHFSTRHLSMNLTLDEMSLYVPTA